MSEILVVAQTPAETVQLYLPVVPRIGESVLYGGKLHQVVRVIHVVSEHPAHVRVELAP